MNVQEFFMEQYDTVRKRSFTIQRTEDSIRYELATPDRHQEEITIPRISSV
jgi:hypothetical protein